MTIVPARPGGDALFTFCLSHWRFDESGFAVADIYYYDEPDELARDVTVGDLFRLGDMCLAKANVSRESSGGDSTDSFVPTIVDAVCDSVEVVSRGNDLLALSLLSFITTSLATTVTSHVDRLGLALDIAGREDA